MTTTFPLSLFRNRIFARVRASTRVLVATVAAAAATKPNARLPATWQRGRFIGDRPARNRNDRIELRLRGATLLRFSRWQIRLSTERYNVHGITLGAVEVPMLLGADGCSTEAKLTRTVILRFEILFPLLLSRELLCSRTLLWRSASCVQGKCTVDIELEYSFELTEMFFA